MVRRSGLGVTWTLRRHGSPSSNSILYICGVHTLAAERVALALAIEKRDPMPAPIGIRREALELARMIAG